MELTQEVLNVYLARFFARRGLLAHPELQLKGRRSIPDVYVQLGGLPTVVEAEVETTPNARQRAWNKVIERLRNRLCYAGVAVAYPGEWRQLDLRSLEEALEQQSLHFAIVLSEESEANWQTRPAEELVGSLRQLPGQILSEEDVKAAVKTLREGVQILSDSFLPMQGIEKRLAEVLGIDPDAVSPHKTKQATAVRHIASLILMNALLFHEELSRWQGVCRL